MHRVSNVPGVPQSAYRTVKGGKKNDAQDGTDGENGEEAARTRAVADQTR